MVISVKTRSSEFNIEGTESVSSLELFEYYSGMVDGLKSYSEYHCKIIFLSSHHFFILATWPLGGTLGEVCTHSFEMLSIAFYWFLLPHTFGPHQSLFDTDKHEFSSNDTAQWKEYETWSMNIIFTIMPL